MTRLDPSPHRPPSQAWMEESQGREGFSRHTGSRERGGESGYLSLRRAGSSRSLRDGSPPSPYRHFEVGHPLPSTRSPEPKATIPFRNPDLGVPSKRRNSESSSEPLQNAPHKYSQHSNFRRSPRSPSPCTPSPTPLEHSQSHRRNSYAYSSTNQRSGHSRSSPRRSSILSHSSSPSRSPSPFRQAEYSGSSHRRHYDTRDYSQGSGRDRRSPSLSSQGRGLDSDRLYKNLNSLASAADFKSEYSSSGNWKSSRTDAEMTTSSQRYGRGSRNPSPSRRGYDTPSQSKATSDDFRCDSRSSYLQNTHDSQAKAGTGTLSGSWRGSARSLCSPAISRSSSPSRRGLDHRQSPHSPKSYSTPTETDRRGSSRNRSSSRRGLEARSPSPEYIRSSHQNRSPSPRMRGHTSSQSSLESDASHQSGGSDAAGMLEEYVVMADIPKIKTIYLREGPRQGGRSQSYITGRQEVYRSSRYSETPDGHRGGDDSRERGRVRERGRDRRERRDGDRGRQSRTQSSTSHHTKRSSSPPEEEDNPVNGYLKPPPGHTQTQTMNRSDRQKGNHSSSLQTDPSGETEKPDLLNFKKGWMCKLDENGEWKKHWFVLTDSTLRYYRDLDAEERDDLDGEIDLRSCVKVSEFEVERNYGFQIQTQEATFTLAAMTSGIRRNWVEVLRKSILPGSSPDIAQLPDSSSGKENSVSRPLASRHPSPRQSDPEAEVTPSAATPGPWSYVELSPVAEPSGSSIANQREVQEECSKEQQRRLEDRSRWFEFEASGKDPAGSPWDTVVLKKGSPPAAQTEGEIERMWVEFERRPMREIPSLLLIGSLPDQPTNESLEREVASLRQQLEQEERDGEGGGGGEGSQCGPDAPCGRSLEAMERAHRREVEELQKQQERVMSQLERERDRLLQEETLATAQAMEALKKGHMEELEQEVESVRRLAGGGANAQALHREQQSETQALQRELDGLSERYSQKCLELNRAEQGNAEREKEISRREREMEQLRKENQELQARLSEEIGRMRSLVPGEGSGSISHGNHERSSSELEMLLRAKENELQYLHTEIGCLRDELHSLNKEKRSVCERYKEVYTELSRMKSRSEQEIEALREHLKLAMAALQEGQHLENSVEH